MEGSRAVDELLSSSALNVPHLHPIVRGVRLLEMVLCQPKDALSCR